MKGKTKKGKEDAIDPCGCLLAEDAEKQQRRVPTLISLILRKGCEESIADSPGQYTSVHKTLGFMDTSG